MKKRKIIHNVNQKCKKQNKTKAWKSLKRTKQIFSLKCMINEMENIIGVSAIKQINQGKESLNFRTGGFLYVFRTGKLLSSLNTLQALLFLLCISDRILHKLC
jgi:hypothetical protein